MANGIAETSFVKKMLEEKFTEKDAEVGSVLKEEDIIGAASTFSQSWTVLSMFVLSMTEHPEIQQKAWAEVEAVIGTDRLPSFADRENLPYVECVMEEVFRRYPAVPMGVPHKSSQDGTYKGYFIPKGSTIYGNAYAMLRDKTMYKDPETFNPSRYLSVELGGYGEPLPIGHFGFGRRICPGRHLATAGVWMVMVIVTVLATLEISRAKEVNGNDIMPVVDFSAGIVSHPRPFLTVLKPRSGKAAELVGVV